LRARLRDLRALREALTWTEARALWATLMALRARRSATLAFFTKAIALRVALLAREARVRIVFLLILDLDWWTLRVLAIIKYAEKKKSCQIFFIYFQICPKFK
jgi:hypothetical protein